MRPLRPHVFLTGFLAAVLLPPLLSACADGDPGAGAEWTVDTLESGLVRTTNPALPHPLPDAPVALERAFRIGQADGPPETVFGAVSGVEVDDEGRIYVLDRQANELRIFSPSGEHLRTSGRSGEGPGEFTNANGLRWFGPDTLVVVDQRGGRYSLMTRDGEFARSIRRDLPFFGWMFTGAVHGDRIFEIGPVQTSSGYTNAIIATGPGVRDTIFGFHQEATPAETYSVQTEVGGMSMMVPFTGRRLLHIDREGRIWDGHGNTFRLVRSTMEGDTLREITVGIDPTPVTREEIEAWEDTDGVRQFVEMGGDLDLDRIPGAKPYMDEVYLDPDGYLWVSVPDGDRITRFVVLDPEGRFVSDLRLEGVQRSPGVPPVVRNDRLHLVTGDDFDVEGVEVFEIRR